MCGIFAYSGSKKTERVLIQGLKNLEYRGYDSAGVAFFERGKIKRYRVCGGVEELEKKIPNFGLKIELGIGHTRWATHGKPSQINAHPHKGGSIYVVHNGVIENSRQIKKIISSGKLVSETDTELIPHLIQFFIQSEGLDFFKAVLKSLPLLKGSYAVAALSEKNPKELIAFKSGPPLILAKKQGDFFVSSDLQALEEGMSFFFLGDEEILYLKDNLPRIFNFKGQPISLKLKKGLKKNKGAKAEKGSHPHFMIKEILEQPEVLSSLIESQLNRQKNKLSLQLSKGSLPALNKLLKKAPQVLILACGSSYFAGLFAKYVLEELSSLSVQVETASEFIYRKPSILPETVVLFISQSGETADILTAFKQIQKWNLKSLSLSNVANSALDRKSDFSLNMQAGPEIAVASTKAFSASLLSLIFLGFHIQKLSLGSNKKESDFIAELLKLPALIKNILSSGRFFLEIMEELKKFKTFFFLGRGLYYPIALEGALKLKEIAYLHAEAYPSGEMKHGPLAMIDKNTALLALFPPPGLLYQKSLSSIKPALSRGAGLIAIGGQKDLKESRQFLTLPKTHKLLHPLLSLIPLQMMAYYISRSYGYNADRPRNLAKSVTVE